MLLNLCGDNVYCLALFDCFDKILCGFGVLFEQAAQPFERVGATLFCGQVGYFPGDIVNVFIVKNCKDFADYQIFNNRLVLRLFLAAALTFFGLRSCNIDGFFRLTMYR